MKPKKTYTRYRVGLFIGLFGFHALSSCVNTGGQLGMRCFESEKKKAYKKKIEQAQKAQEANPLHGQAPPREELSFRYAKDPWYRSKLGILGLVGGVILLAGGGSILWCLPGSGSMVAIPPYMSNTTTTRDTLYHPVNRTDTFNHNDSESSGPFKDPMLLDEEVIAELREANFSKEKVEELITTRRLNVNAMTKEGEGFLIYLLGKNTDAFKYLLHLGADPNLIAPNGSTALVGAIWGSHRSEFDALLQDPRTDVCPKESDLVLSAASRSGSYFMAELQKARQKCPEEHSKQKREISNLFIIPKLNEADKMLREGEKKWGTLPNKTKSKQRSTTGSRNKIVKKRGNAKE